MDFETDARGIFTGGVNIDGLARPFSGSGFWYQEEEEAVLAVLRQRWLTMGGVTQEFEEPFAAHLTGAKHALAVTNATVALHLACLALGIGPGDEVIVPSLTFVATANAVLLHRRRRCALRISSGRTI